MNGNAEWIVAVLGVVNLVLIAVLLLRRGGGAGGDIEKVIRRELREARDESSSAARELREEVASSQKAATDTMVNAVVQIGKTQKEELEILSGRTRELTRSNEEAIEKLRSKVDGKLNDIQQNNEKKLDQIRETVDEKLQTTLEKRLGESFKLVSERLEAVQRGLGEMQNLATGVGDLKKVLTNVKTRGTWGEIQLGAILDQIMTPDQYSSNVKVKKGSDEIVEFAIRLPGPDQDDGSCVWLPIDSKFPQEDYIRLVDASESGETDKVQQASDSLLKAVYSSAATISEKYIDPPSTTDFAIMFLPTEGLYAEVLRQAGAVERLQRDFRVVVTGPTTLAALLSSLRMGFRTLAIEKRSSEVWKILSAVKTEFGKFGNVLDKLKKQLNAASNTIDQTGVRTRVMERKLRSVEQLPGPEASGLLGLSGDGQDVEVEAEFEQED